MESPSLALRVVSTIIDNVAVAAICIASSYVLSTNDPGLIRIRTIAWISTYFLLEPILTSKATTLGQAMFGIRVIDENTLTRLPFYRAFIRFVIKLFGGTISLAVVPLSKKRKAIHDMVVGSVVVFANQELKGQP